MAVSRSKGMDLARTAAWQEHGRRHRYLFTFGGTIAKLMVFLALAIGAAVAYHYIPHFLLAAITGLVAGVLLAWSMWRELALVNAAKRLSGRRSPVVSMLMVFAALMLLVASVGILVSG